VRTPVPGALASDLLSVLTPVSFVAVCALLVAGAFAAGRRRAGLAAAVTLVGANATTQMLKPLLAVQRPYPAGNYLSPEAWPSGHTTAIVSLLLALVIVFPPRLRPPVAAIGGAVAALALGSILLLGFHYPSDVLGGILVSGGWCAAALAVSGSGRAPRAARPRPRSRRATG
jgi:membrane-associated phospholipid phosphatase